MVFLSFFNLGAKLKKTAKQTQEKMQKKYDTHEK